MSEPNTDRRLESSSPAGIIDTIGFSFGLLNRRPYLIWMPILFDLLLWSRARVQIDPLSGAGNSETRDSLGDIVGRTAEIELVSIVTWALPTLIQDSGADVAPLPVAIGTLEIQAAPGLIGLFVAVTLSILVTMSYLTLVGRLVRGAPARGSSLFFDCLASGVRGGGVLLSVIAVILFMLIPFGLVSLGLDLIGVNPTLLMVLAGALLSAWLGLFFLQSFSALALGEDGVFRAMRASYQVAQQNFLAFIALLAIIVLIRAGTPPALSVFMESRWSVPFAIIVNAYVATGLVAALLLFFQNRSTQLTTQSSESTGVAAG